MKAKVQDGCELAPGSALEVLENSLLCFQQTSQQARRPWTLSPLLPTGDPRPSLTSCLPCDPKCHHATWHLYHPVEFSGQREVT